MVVIQGSEQHSAAMDYVSQTVLDLIAYFIFSVGLFIPKQCGIEVCFQHYDFYFLVTNSLMVGNSITNSS